jgi:hypothetical protein
MTFLVRVEATAWTTPTKQAPARIGRDDDGNVVTLRLDGVKLRSGDIDHVCRLSHLERLSLNRTSITDHDLRKLTRLRHLRGLSLNQTVIGDSGIEALAEFPSLRTLCLFGTKATHESVRALKARRKGLQLGYVQSKD